MDEKLLTARDVAELLHVSLSYAYLLMRRGDIRIVRLGSAIRVRREDLDRYISDHCTVCSLPPDPPLHT